MPSDLDHVETPHRTVEKRGLRKTTLKSKLWERSTRPQSDRSAQGYHRNRILVRTPPSFNRLLLRSPTIRLHCIHLHSCLLFWISRAKNLSESAETPPEEYQTGSSSPGKCSDPHHMADWSPVCPSSRRSSRQQAPGCPSSVAESTATGATVYSESTLRSRYPDIWTKVSKGSSPESRQVRYRCGGRDFCLTSHIQSKTTCCGSPK